MVRRLLKAAGLGAGSLLLTGALLGSGGCERAQGSPHGAPQAHAQGPALVLETAPVKREAFTALYRASATLRGRNTAVITAKTTGYVKRLFVKPGQQVRAGQLLVLLESKELQAGVRRARGAIVEAEEAQVEASNAVHAASANLSIAKLGFERSQKLLKHAAVAQHEYDQTEAQHRAVTAQKAMAEARKLGIGARIEQARAELMQAEANLAYTRVTAPFAGRVIEQKLDPGNLAAPGTPLLVLEQEGRFRAEATVEESLVGKLKVGGTAMVELEHLGHPLEGTISEVVPSVDVGSRAFLVKVELPETVAGATLQPGLYAKVSFRQGGSQRIAVPERAIRPLGQLDRVFVVADGRANARLVTLGERQNGRVEVLSGLDAGETVAVAPPATLRDGQPVQSAAAAPAAAATPARPTVGTLATSATQVVRK